jgi:phage replication O-like protein O
MANPQLEDGHTRIANELLDNIARVHLSSYQWQVLIFIIRKTYGYQKKLDHITNSQIVQGTGIYKTHVSRTISELVNRRILTKNGGLIGLQKDYELWLPKLPKEVTINSQVTKNGNNQKLPILESELPILESELPKEVTKVTCPLDTQKKKETIQKKLYKRNATTKGQKEIYTPIDPAKYRTQRYGDLVQR